MIDPPLALHATPGGSLLTVADSWTLVPAIMLAGAPEIATLGCGATLVWDGGVLVTSMDTVAIAGLNGKGLLGSRAANVKLSAPM